MENFSIAVVDGVVIDVQQPIGFEQPVELIAETASHYPAIAERPQVNELSAPETVLMVGAFVTGISFLVAAARTHRRK